MKLTKSGTYIYGKAKLTRFEEIFEEYKVCFCIFQKNRVYYM